MTPTQLKVYITEIFKRKTLNKTISQSSYYTIGNLSKCVKVEIILMIVIKYSNSYDNTARHPIYNNNIYV